MVWRSYFKGWLEQRPTTWDSYRDGLERDFETLAIDRKLRAQVQAATEARSGLACFDAWASELLETGYLHNHARMWFASIWIFTFGLPWRVGADFFLRNLLDGDPASNTLGWRWVAGLHTRGKTYAAQAWNIAQFTDGRFAPREADLAPDAPALVHEEPDGLPSRLGLRAPVVPDLSKPTALAADRRGLHPNPARRVEHCHHRHACGQPSAFTRNRLATMSPRSNAPHCTTRCNGWAITRSTCVRACPEIWRNGPRRPVRARSSRPSCHAGRCATG